MSRWLKSVNNLLETLDTGVENVVENQAELYEDTYEDEVGGQSSVEDILAKRGLLTADPEEDEANEEEVNVHLIEIDNEEDLDSTSETADADADLDGLPMDQEAEDGYNSGGDAVNQLHSEGNKMNDNIDTALDQLTNATETSEAAGGQGVSTDEELQNDASEENGEEEQVQEDDSQSQSVEQAHNNETEEPSQKDNKERLLDEQIHHEPIVIPATDTKEEHMQHNAHLPVASTIARNDAVFAQIATLKRTLEVQKKLTTDSTSEKNNAVKETRKLRRNLVKLNAELDSAERELEAQRTELERAAARMEKDRQRYKEEKDRLELSHQENLKAITDEHKASIQAMVNAHAKQIGGMEDRVERAEEARMKEGGDMSAELAEATGRERDTLKKAIVLEEEKSTFACQVSSLKTQIVGLESRIDTLQQAAESATEQERDADDRLDVALSLHARQLSQRQAREAELERTVADLGAALVASKLREGALSKNSSGREGSGTFIAELRDKLLSAKDEVELLSNQLMIERQKAETLQRELQDITDEQVQETVAVLGREKEYDQRVSELTSTISTLQLKQNFSRHSSSGNVGESSSETNAITQKLRKQVSSLSEDLIRQNAKLQHSSTEIQTLRNRLQSALSRAEIAEKAAQAQVFDIESNSSVRLRNVTNGRNQVASIKSAFKLETGRGEIRESIGKVVDTIDIVAVDLGSYFRSDPFARAFFLFYLMILHLWAFFLVVFHAHGTLEPSSDVGPEQLLMHSYRHIEQAKNP